MNTTIDLFTTFNTKTKKACVLVSIEGKSKPFVVDVVANQYLRTLLNQVGNCVLQILPLKLQKINLVFHRFKDLNMGTSLSKVIRVIEHLNQLDESCHDEFIQKSFIRNNGTKPKSYDELVRLTYLILRLKDQVEELNLRIVTSNNALSKDAFAFCR